MLKEINLPDQLISNLQVQQAQAVPLRGNACARIVDKTSNVVVFKTKKLPYKLQEPWRKRFAARRTACACRIEIAT